MAEPAPRPLWTAVLVTPVVWGIQGLFGWYAASQACPGASQQWSLSTARWLIGIVTVIALAVSVWALITSRRLRHDGEKTRYLSMAALVVSGALTLGLFFAFMPTWWIGLCGEMR